MYYVYITQRNATVHKYYNKSKGLMLKYMKIAKFPREQFASSEQYSIACVCERKNYILNTLSHDIDTHSRTLIIGMNF